MENTLLSRIEFRESVFTRDRHKCIVCSRPAQDAHHILERRLFSDGGYYLDNGASVCDECHMLAEQTTISCEKLRTFAGIKTIVLPEHFYPEQSYDKWGNIVLPNGNRLPGELFYDSSVQEILKPLLGIFTNRVKYPRTYHLPWSDGATNDDKVLTDLSRLQNSEVVVTAKMDGENTTLYRDGMHARSIDYEAHPSRSLLKAFHAQIANDIPEGWRICGENLYAKHSIHYHNLENHFLVFSIWNDMNVCLSWEETLEWAKLFGCSVVPTIYRGEWDEAMIKRLFRSTLNGDECEGYVVRVAEEFAYGRFRNCVAKYVRKNHVKTDQHWMNNSIIVNGLHINNA